MKKMGYRRTKNILPYFSLLFIAAMFILPLLWVIVASFDSQAQQSLKLPDSFTLSNYSSVLSDPANQRAFMIGLLLSGCQTLIVVFCSALAAYPLSRFKLKGKQKLMLVILFLTSLPITAVMVPVYQLFLMINLQDSIIGTMLFLSASSLPYGIWMMKNFMDNVPVELEESAWIDGASLFTSLRRVVAPLMVPGLFTVCIFTFIGSWGNFFVPFILLQSPDKLPASVTIFQFFGQFGTVQYGQLAAYSMLYMIPTFVLYGIAQRYMSQGFVLSGAAKG
ncbi:carbohydrate ABC transporter permease [Fictibacillus fluitans]|uniref:Carbohydrate ABC transporter permease n=1 Tax=Fictibacillus fluitans TaxID=3058422 RepID=A0ABT8HTJ6_9BACL|nr:carbohydrate ABC transporter permease [Fictibacillus sp. NE201]MDN4524081.1 carbohydrate ABC transporter permease [Fictibacillus sp. NE201]